MDLQSLGKSDVGCSREHNEDYLVCDPALGLFIVCDGMGGHAAGEVASRIAAETVTSVVRSAESELDDASEAELRERLPEIMRRAVEMANTAVFQAGKSKKTTRGAGTTCTALLVRSDLGVLAHVGDSRLYLSRAGALSQLSNDHTFVAEAIRRGMIKPDEAEGHRASNLLTRAVGPQEKVHVDTLVFDVLPDDTFLLCSDGLHGYFPDADELEQHLGGALETLVDQLILLSNERGGEDNITAVVVRAAQPQSEEEQKRISSLNESFDALKHIALLSELDLPELMEVRESLDTEIHPPGKVIVQEGETTEAMYVIVKGSLEVRRAGKPLAFLDSGSHFGEMALLTDAPRSATVRTASPCRLLVLHRDKLFDLVQRKPLIGVKFLWRLAQIQSRRLDDATMPVDAERARTIRLELYPSPFSFGRKKDK